MSAEVDIRINVKGIVFEQIARGGIGKIRKSRKLCGSGKVIGLAGHVTFDVIMLAVYRNRLVGIRRIQRLAPRQVVIRSV